MNDKVFVSIPGDNTSCFYTLEPSLLLSVSLLKAVANSLCFMNKYDKSLGVVVGRVFISELSE